MSNNQEEDKLKEEKIKLLYEAIKDTQNIIARLDTKARFYLAIYFVISGGLLSGLYTVLKLGLYKNHKELLGIIGIIIVFLLGYLIWLTKTTIDEVISPQSNPSEKVKSPPEEIFTSNNKKTTIFFPIADIEGKFNFNVYKNSLNRLDDLSKIEDLLLFELLKVSAIREEKIKNMKKIEKYLENMLYILLIILVTALIFYFVYLYCM